MYSVHVSINEYGKIEIKTVETVQMKNREEAEKYLEKWQACKAMKFEQHQVPTTAVSHQPWRSPPRLVPMESCMMPSPRSRLLSPPGNPAPENFSQAMMHNPQRPTTLPQMQTWQHTYDDWYGARYVQEMEKYEAQKPLLKRKAEKTKPATLSATLQRQFVPRKLTFEPINIQNTANNSNHVKD